MQLRFQAFCSCSTVCGGARGAVFGSRSGSKVRPSAGLGAVGIGAGQPEADVEQFLHGGQRIDCRTGLLLCTARLPRSLMTCALLNTASPTACRKLGSWIRALMLS